RPRGRSFGPVAAVRPAAGPARVEAEDGAILGLDQLEVSGALGADEMASHRLAGDEHQRLEPLLPRVLVDVELLVAPREERQEHLVPHRADRAFAEPLHDLAHEPVGVVDVAVVALTPRLLELVELLERLRPARAVDERDELL